ncbi:hypothetical protein SD70_13215 [Gordoniibacillus kamchatkensis]|uniref:Sulfatase N-terminal domain-containing protein n=1 Tax=Gordoniibacillus kamchatkensis TaxID=1590651 RepID=A0ABR5AHL9_9BACL|nr:sulfatase [Paenibacillus sp. VKM B-2647]KIL40517.1 hypothetical protein SD70_13215 [Paenibacillus sp. VKM B-2647]
MNVIFITIDSLNRHFLKAYGQPIELDVKTPNLDRFAAKAAVFDKHYVGSLPCIPARREFYTGIQEFLWRAWGPVEAYDVPVARAARQNGYVTQFITDQFHHFNNGSHGYFSDYQGFELIRGHELDAWKTAPLQNPDTPFLKQLKYGGQPETAPFNRLAYAKNVEHLKEEIDFFAPKVFTSAAEWLESNHTHEKFMLVVDSYDVHEPFHNPDEFASLYTEENIHDPDMPLWPVYGNTQLDGHAKLNERQVAFVRSQFAAKLTLVDKWFGKVLDKLDEHRLWDNTMVIVTSDHGHFLGEKGWMGKPACTTYNVLANIPLIVWHPLGTHNRKRISALSSSVDVYATMLEAMGIGIKHQVHSRSLLPLVLGQAESVRDWALYGYFGKAVNITDGEYTYHVAPNTEAPVYNYSTMYMNPVASMLPVNVPDKVEAGRYLPYTDAMVWKYEAKVPEEFKAFFKSHYETALYHVQEDAWQNDNLLDREPGQLRRMKQLLLVALADMQAPAEVYERLGMTAR